jgi:hypothetical protein
MGRPRDVAVARRLAPHLRLRHRRGDRPLGQAHASGQVHRAASHASPPAPPGRLFGLWCLCGHSAPQRDLPGLHDAAGVGALSWREQPHDDLVLAVALAAWYAEYEAREAERRTVHVGSYLGSDDDDDDRGLRHS